MLKELRLAFRPAITLLLGFTLVLGIGYPLVVTGLARILLPAQAGGSLISVNGQIVGSELIGQNFAAPRYFHPRPSAAGKAGYDASASAAGNLAPGAADLATRIAASAKALRKEDRIAGSLPSDMVTTSASGLDPHISPAAARLQVARVAAARGLQPEAVSALLARHIEGRELGLLGEPRVNVLVLNLALDGMSAQHPAQE